MPPASTCAAPTSTQCAPQKPARPARLIPSTPRAPSAMPLPAAALQFFYQQCSSQQQRNNLSTSIFSPMIFVATMRSAHIREAALKDSNAHAHAESANPQTSCAPPQDITPNGGLARPQVLPHPAGLLRMLDVTFPYRISPVPHETPHDFARYEQYRPTRVLPPARM